MAKNRKTSDESTQANPPLSGELAAEIVRHKKLKAHNPAARRRLVARLHREGYSVPEIVNELASTLATIRRDGALLRKDAAGRQLAAAPETCSPLFLEEAEDVVRKVRRAQRDLGDNKEGTFFLNLLKLEWTMLVKLAEITRSQARKKNGDAGDEFDDLSKCSNEELLDQARGLGIDVSGFERALRLLPDEAA